MNKYLRFKTANGDRLLNVEACDIVTRLDVNTITIYPVPFQSVNSEWSITRDGANGIDFDGELIDMINDAIIKAEQTSYTKVMIDVDIPSKYAIEDIVLT